MSVKARASITIEIECKSNWSDNTTVEQVKKQAIVDAEEVINKAFNLKGTLFNVIGDIKIKIVTFDV